ncbi:FAAR183Cp [Eremothecium gossypii FDAG1]|nr:FAAR183Cp [Eremothecium gossypii FDAG1]
MVQSPSIAILVAWGLQCKGLPDAILRTVIALLLATDRSGMVSYGLMGNFSKKMVHRGMGRWRFRGHRWSLRYIRICVRTVMVFSMLALVLQYSGKILVASILHNSVRPSSKTPLHTVHAVEQRQFGRWPLEKKCQWYFAKEKRQQWLNEIIERSRGRMKDASVTAAMLERLRVFDTCFMQGDIGLREVFGEDINLYSLHHELFPFLKKVRDWSELLPQVLDLNDGSRYLLGNKLPEQAFKVDNDLPFWENLRRSSSGRGIVATVADIHLDQLKRLLHVLDELGNKLPIELVYKGNDFSRLPIKRLKRYVRQHTKQRVRLVDCSRVLRSTHIPKIKRFMNKWLATIFNSFEEIILLDVDVVPLVPIDSYFKLPGYTKTGALFFKDRTLPEYLPVSCTKAILLLPPSSEENKLWGHSMRYRTPMTKAGALDRTNSAETEVMYNYFIERYRHQVETGLVVLNRKQRLFSLVTSFMIHLNLRFSECFHGDKEVFWLGQLLTGNEYSIHPMPAAIIGELQQGERKLAATEYRICSTQIAHPDTDGTVLWINGGMWNCKDNKAAEEDFSDYNRYFTRKFGSQQKLADWYKQTLKVTGVFSPELKNSKWIPAKECKQSAFCSSVFVHDDEELQSLKDADISVCNHLASVWGSLPE